MKRHHGPRSALRRFLDSETAGGLTLIGAATVALALANSPLAAAYDAITHFGLGGVSLVHAVNDGLMAVFFLLVGLEIKRELVSGELSTWRRRILPGVAALGGMAVPALVFVAFNAGSPETLDGWAVPAATDIAFSLAVLAILGSRVPVSLKILLTALAIIDDLGAVIVIALFYAHDPSLPMIGLAVLALIALAVLNRLGVTSLWPYLGLGLVLWGLVLQSGVHATVAGVLVAATIPLGPGRSDHAAGAASPLIRLENILDPWVTFAVLPVFAFVNAGVTVIGIEPAGLVSPVTLGVGLGLFLGKQIGIFGAVWLAVKSGAARLPRGASFLHIYGMALLCGIGFTMSLFIGLLAFGEQPLLVGQTKVGVLAGSLAAALAGWALLRLAPRASRGSAKGESAT